MISQHVNLYFPICSFAVNIILCIIFFSKNKIKNVDNMTYSKLLIVGLLESSFMFFINLLVCICFTEENYPIFAILNKTLYSIYIIWTTILFFYIYKISGFSNENKVHIISFIIDLIIICLIYALPIDFYYENHLSNSSGMSANMLYLGSTIYLIAMFIIALLSIKKARIKKKYLPLAILLVLMSIMMIIRQVDPLFNVSSNVLSIVMLVMYFTIENPDIQMVEELIENRKMVERSSEEKTIFLFKISQGLKQSVSNIEKEITNYKKNKLTKKDIDDVINNIYANNQKINYIINDVIGINLYTKNNIKMEGNNYNIINLLKEVETRIKPNLNSNISFNLTYASSMPNLLKGDDIKLKQVLISILKIIIENSSSGFVNIDINAITRYDICRMVILVETSMIKFNLKEINNILNQTIEINEEEKAKIDKFKLDIALCYKIIKSLGGTMNIKSDNNTTQIIITLDQEIVSYDSLSDNVYNYIKTRANAKKAIIVDDDENEIRKIKILLEQLGYDVSASMFGEETINRIKNDEKFDIILIDDEMLTMSGMALLQELNKLKNKSKKLVLLEDNKLFIAKHYVDDGFDDYIDKTNLSEEINKKCAR